MQFYDSQKNVLSASVSPRAPAGSVTCTGRKEAAGFNFIRDQQDNNPPHFLFRSHQVMHHAVSFFSLRYSFMMPLILSSLLTYTRVTGHGDEPVLWFGFGILTENVSS